MWMSIMILNQNQFWKNKNYKFYDYGGSPQFEYIRGEVNASISYENEHPGIIYSRESEYDYLSSIFSSKNII